MKDTHKQEKSERIYHNKKKQKREEVRHQKTTDMFLISLCVFQQIHSKLMISSEWDVISLYFFRNSGFGN